ncbi:DUF2848 family protein [Priestia megaterium]|jgi:hypothetical protein|uniref:DUF2848 family protein n=1 Tax=Priestia megaterium TaxID=1404 RepID=UPI000BEBE4E6|nr:DUF2848 family protein [Priestia megaterium]MDI3090336.1 DUF2848 family protein [Priestia megaterium]MED3854948.1 DUF2848 family protein [Priestia megaterium]PEB60270.1 hypothetical protein COM86_30945 [Priestia megaterium]
MENKLILNIQGINQKLEFCVKNIFNAGYAGVNQEKVQEHIDELAKLGVETPNTIPTLYPVANQLATYSGSFQVQHNETSGEIEYVLLWADNEMYVTVGSDHTDRRLETFSVPMSKQACPNILAREVWKFEEVKDHWNQIELTCWIRSNGEEQLYQKGTCGELMSPKNLIENFKEMKIGQDGHVFYSGTIGTVGNSLAYGDEYVIEMNDPVLNRVITHQYKLEFLPEEIG